MAAILALWWRRAAAMLPFPEATGHYARDARRRRIGGRELETFREVTIGSGLMLHAPATIRLDAAVLQADFASLDAALPPEGRTHFGAAAGTGWTGIPLMVGQRLPALGLLPALCALMDRPELEVRRAYVLRLPPGGVLAWHFERCALHLDEARLLIPIHVPDGAATLLGHASAAYPAGQVWTGDFAFPHQVENPTGRDRIVVTVDVACTPAVRALFPPALAAEPQRRRALAAEAQGLLRAWQHGAPAPLVPA